MKHRFFIISMLLACSLLGHATAVTVPAGSGTINTAYTANPAADTLLLSGTYTLSSNLEITRSVVFCSTDDAVVNVSASFRPKASDINVAFSGIRFEGAARTIYVSDGTKTGIRLTVDNCVFSNNTRAIYILRGWSTIAELRISRSTFINCGPNGDRTIYCTIDDGDSDLHPVDMIVDHCSFFNNSNGRMVYFPNYDGAIIQNCLAVNETENASYKSFAIYGSNSRLINTCSYNIEPYVRSSAQAINVSTQNPLIVDLANGDYRYFANSPCIGAATDGTNLGDPRWGVAAENADPSHFPLVLVKKPWTMSPTTSSIRILWESEDPDYAMGKVMYGTTPALGQEVTSANGWSIAGEGYVHVVELTDLEPFTRYYFKVGDETRTYDLLCSTKTAPEEGTAYRIFTLSDIHQNSCRNWENMQSFITGLNADLAVFNGDFINEGNTRPWNSSFFTPGEPFLEQTPIMSSPGNHETGDPTSYRYSTFYDYFSQFTHGASEDPIKDPRGESYFTFPYGNAQMVVININGDASSPDFGPGSRQYQWIDSVLQSSTKPWTLIFGHVGIYTSGYHGQWSAEAKRLAPLLERYASQGKRIIYFCGDDHSFEHLYKDGVHYVRPGCGRNSNYAQQTALVDAQYSMFYRQISCYSTLDMAAVASSILLTARDSASNEFYSYTFRLAGEEIAPSVTFSAPAKEEAVVDSALIQWFSFDPSKQATIRFFYSQQSDAKDGTTIASGISALPNAQKRLWWQTRDIMPKGTYFIYATITSGTSSATFRAPGSILLEEDTIAPTAPTGLTGDVRNGQYFIAWQNPTHPIHLDNLLQDFQNGMEGFVADGDHGSAVLALKDAALQVDYTVTEAWGEGAANYAYAEPTDLSSTPFLTFRMKGDGSNRSLRLVVKNDFYGHEDWWYTESVGLSNKDWQTYTIDLRTLAGFDWHANSDTRNQLEGVRQICFIIPSSAPATGTIWLDDIHVSGDVLPCRDFAATLILRNDDHFATSPLDGTLVYEGAAETCVDQQADPAVTYYYAAFSRDDRMNYSAPAPAAQWLSSNLNPLAALDQVATASAYKMLIDGQLIIHAGANIYNALGQLINQ